MKPADRIRGITAILGEILAKEELPWAKKETTEEIYLEAFYFPAIYDESFKIFSMAPPDPKLLLDLPSWCPDYQNKTTTNLASGFSGMVETTWRASSTKQTIHRGLDSKKLRLTGIRVDGVIAVSQAWKTLNLDDCTQTADEIQAKVHYDATFFNVLQSVLDQNPGLNQQRLSALLQRFLMTLFLESLDVPWSSELDFEDFFRLNDFIIRAVSPSSSYVEESKRSKDRCHQSDHLERPWDPDILEKLDIQLRNRVFFVMENGKFGLAYPGLRPGDGLCVFCGAKVPHLLRWQEGSSAWTFVGEAYVIDLMHGEAETASDGSVPKVETLTLV